MVVIVVVVELPERRSMVGCRQRQERSDLVLIRLVKILIKILVVLKISLILEEVLLVVDERRYRMNWPRIFPHVGHEFAIEIHRIEAIRTIHKILISRNYYFRAHYVSETRSFGTVWKRLSSDSDICGNLCSSEI